MRDAINEASLDLPDGEYALVIANPVPYNCNLKWLADWSARSASATADDANAQPQKSAGIALSTLRDYVWNTLWLARFVQDEFVARIDAYAPVAILNCCTGLLRQHVSAFLITTTRFGDRIFEGSHPSVQWNIKYAIKANRTPSVGAIKRRATRSAPQPFRPVTVKRLD